MTKFRAWAIDAAERIAATFVEAAAGTIPAALIVASKLDLDTIEAIGAGAAVAGVSAVAALAKTSAAAFLKKGSSTPAGLVDVPNPQDHPAAGPGVIRPISSPIIDAARTAGMPEPTRPNNPPSSEKGPIG